MKKAYSYIRFSRPEQLKGDSLRRQLEKSKAWCDAHDYVLDESLNLKDLGVSAYKGRNALKGKLGGFLKAVEDGRVEKGAVLIVESLDRITRQEVPVALELFLRILNSGVIIITIDPEDRFEHGKLNEIQLIIVIVILSRANNESSMKSVRLKCAWEQKRRTIEVKPLTKLGPSWLRLVDGKWELIDEKVHVIRWIFELSKNGHGINRIVKTLNSTGTPPLKPTQRTRQGTLEPIRIKSWQRSSIMKLLHSRAVIGEFTPRYGRGGTNVSQRPAAGDAIPNYYPQIIDLDTFYSVQRGLAFRRNQRGPSGHKITNLFKELMVSAADDHPMIIVDKGAKSTGPAIVSSGAVRGVIGSKYLSFPYCQFESAFLELCSAVNVEDIFPVKSRSQDQDEMKKLSGELSHIDHRMMEVKDKINGDEFLESTLFDVLKSLIVRRQHVEKSIEELKLKMHSDKSRCLEDTKRLSTLLANATSEELVEVRLLLRAHIVELIEKIKIRIWVDETKKHKALIARLQFRDGAEETLICRRSVSFFRTGATPERITTCQNEVGIKVPKEFLGSVQEFNSFGITPCFLEIPQNWL